MAKIVPQVGDRVRITSDDDRSLIGLTGFLFDIDLEDDGLPYRVKFDTANPDGCDSEWVKEVEVVARVGSVGIDPQALADYIHSSMGSDALEDLKQHFNLPEPTPSKRKIMTVTMQIDVTGRGDEFTELGDTYGAFISLLYEYFDRGSETAIGLEEMTNENISVTIKEEN